MPLTMLGYAYYARVSFMLAKVSMTLLTIKISKMQCRVHLFKVHPYLEPISGNFQK